MAITLQESLRGLFYAPFYVALAHGAYAREGVEVRFVSAPEPGKAAMDSPAAAPASRSVSYAIRAPYPEEISPPFLIYKGAWPRPNTLVVEYGP